MTISAMARINNISGMPIPNMGCLLADPRPTGRFWINDGWYLEYVYQNLR
jgi:hypothetical protein